MAISITCHSCGHRIEVAEDFTRRKVRCPECGVMCEVTGAARDSPATPRAGKRSAPPAAEQDAEELARQLWSEPEEKKPAKPARAKPSEEASAGEEIPLRALPPSPALQSSVTWTEEDEDGNPYDVSGGLPSACAQCGTALEPGTALCIHCGLDRKTGKKAVLEYTRFERTWEPGLSYEGRLGLFRIVAGASFVLSIATAIFLGPWYISIGPWVVFVAMMAFLLGTFDRTDLARDRRGNVRLTRTWRVVFVRRPTATIDLREYDGVVTGRSLDAGCYEWFIFFTLLPFFVLPGILWWYHIIHKLKYHAALTRSHGYPEITLYRGNSQERAEEVATTLRDAAHLQYDRG